MPIAPLVAGDLIAAEEFDRERQHHIIDEGRAHHEQHRRPQQEGQEGALLMLVEAGRHEHPELGGDDGKAQAGAAEHGDLDLGEEDLRQRGIDQVVGGGGERPLQESRGSGVEKAKQTPKQMPKDEHRIDQPAPELEQMLHQRRACVASSAASSSGVGWITARRSAEMFAGRLVRWPSGSGAVSWTGHRCGSSLSAV